MSSGNRLIARLTRHGTCNETAHAANDREQSQFPAAGPQVNKAKRTQKAAYAEFPPSTARELIKPCADRPYWVSPDKVRVDFVVDTLDEAKRKACELAGIDPDKPNPSEEIRNTYDDETKELIGWEAWTTTEPRKRVARVHFHSSDLEGHRFKDEGKFKDYIGEMPHVNYDNWRGGKNDGHKGHVVFKG
jgi:hypothetical protein